MDRKNYLFFFDFDSTVARAETLPFLAERLGFGEKMAELTEQAMAGGMPYEESFRLRAGMLSALPVSEAQSLTAEIPIHEELGRFLREHRERCWILSGGLDVWIAPVLRRLGMEGRCLCSESRVENDMVAEIVRVADKRVLAERFTEPFVAVGDGANDLPMIERAEIGVACCLVREAPDSLKRAAKYTVREEGELCTLLHRLAEA